MRDDYLLGYIEKDRNLPDLRIIDGGKRMRKGKKSLKNKKETNKRKSKNPENLTKKNNYSPLTFSLDPNPNQEVDEFTSCFSSFNCCFTSSVSTN